MAYVIIENFNGGWDTRRLESAGTPGTLLELTNAHITRGGEIEKRRAFVSKYSLPAGTVGLASTINQLWVFGSGPDPGVPPGINYQRLQHPTNPGGTNLTEILSWDTFANKLYVAAKFSDGSVHHFYDGNYVQDWWDGVARGSFVIAETDNQIGTKAQFTTSTATDGNDLTVEPFLLNPEGDEKTSLTGGPVSINGSDAPFTYAQKLANAINGISGSTGMEAVQILGSVAIQPVDRTRSMEDWRVVFEVDESGSGGFSVEVSPDSTSHSCISQGACTNRFFLTANVSGGTSPYSYSWEVTTGGATEVEAVFEDTGTNTSTAESPVLRVSSRTTSVGRAVLCNVKVEVTDDAAATTTGWAALGSVHHRERRSRFSLREE